MAIFREENGKWKENTGERERAEHNVWTWEETESDNGRRERETKIKRERKRD